MKFFVGYMLRLLSIGIMVCIPTVSFASLVPFTEADCPLLARPKTVLLVHATWCSICQDFLPMYERVSNLSKYKDWIFYNVIADDLTQICGIWIDGYPYTYRNNMRAVLAGGRPQAVLEHFLDNK